LNLDHGNDRIQLITQGYSSNWVQVIKGLMDDNKQWSLIQLWDILVGLQKELVSQNSENIAVDSLLTVGHMGPEKKLRTDSLTQKASDASSTRPHRRGSGERKQEGLFKCDFPGCTKVYGKKYTLNRHKKIHLSISNHICGWCSRPFVDNSSLARHERSHSGYKPFACPYQQTCGKRFAESNNLKQHILRMHDGVFQTKENPDR